MSETQYFSLDFFRVSITIVFAVFLVSIIKTNRNLQGQKLQLVRLSQQLGDLVEKQEASTPKRSSFSKAFHTVTEISLTDPHLKESNSYPGPTADATEGNNHRDRDNVTIDDTPSPQIELGQDRVQVSEFCRSVHENKMALEARGYSRKSTEAQTFRIPIATSTCSSLSFMPHSSTAHVTSMTLPTLAILVRRLGLFWKTFDPVHGILLAEGNQQSLESVPSDNPSTIYLHYNISSLSTSSWLTSEQYLTVPTPEATHFLFGTIPPFPRLSIPAFSIHSISAIHEVANVLDPSGRMSQKIHDVRSFVPNCTLGFSDIIPFAAPMMRARGNAVTRVPSPSQYTGGLTRHQDGFRIFRLRLGQYLTERGGTERMKWVRETYDKLLATFPADWETEIQPMDSINSPSRIPFLDHCHNVWDQCTAYLAELNAVKLPAASDLVPTVPPYPSSPAPTPTGFTYYALMVAHLQHAVGYWSDAWKRVKDGTARDALGGHDWIAEGAHCYWDYLPRIVATLREGTALAEGTSEAKATTDEANVEGVEEEQDERSPIKVTAVHEAWIVMMLRAFCWWRCHWTDQGWLGDDEVRVDPRYWDNGVATGTVDERRVYVF